MSPAVSEGEIGFRVLVADDFDGSLILIESRGELSGRDEDPVGSFAGWAGGPDPGGALGVAELRMDGDERAERDFESVLERGEDREFGRVGDLGRCRESGAHVLLDFGCRALRDASASRLRKLWPSIRQMSA